MKYRLNKVIFNIRIGTVYSVSCYYGYGDKITYIVNPYAFYIGDIFRKYMYPFYISKSKAEKVAKKKNRKIN